MIRTFRILALIAGLAAATAQSAENPPSRPSREAPARSFRLGIGGPVLFADGEPFFGASVFGLSEISPNVLVGGETGFFTWSKSSGSVSANQWVIPFLATALYRFDAGSGNVSPYVGASIGPSIVHTAAHVGGFSGTGTETMLQAMARAGIQFGEEKNLIADVKLGVIGSTFVWAPSINYLF